MATESAGERLDRAIAQVAARFHGIITYGQLVECGANSPAIALRVRSGRLNRLHRGVYSVVPPKLLSARGRWLAAVLACGRGAVLSHLDAAALWADANLIVEVDGWESHGTRSAFEADRERDASLTARGYRVVRFTWRQVKYDGPGVARTLRAILAS